MVKGLALAVVGLVLASGCGRSQKTQESGGGDIGSSGSGRLDPGGTGGGGIAGQGGVAAGGSAGNSSDSGKAGAGGLGEVGGAATSGSGGFAGSGVPLTDAEVCADACEQSGNVLPNALCEDWRFPDDEHVAEYCIPVETFECTVLCEKELGAVSPACNAALHRALPCVARSELYHEGLITFGCLFQECTPLLVRVSAECNGVRQELERARELWASADSDSYSYTFSTGSSVVDVVVRNGVASAVGGTPTSVPTIPELFDRIEDSLELISSSVTYDEMLGYPREAVGHSSGCNNGDEAYVYSYSFAVTDLVLE